VMVGGGERCERGRSVVQFVANEKRQTGKHGYRTSVTWPIRAVKLFQEAEMVLEKNSVM